MAPLQLPVSRTSLRPSRLPLHLYLLAAGTFFIGTDVFVIAGMLPGISSSLGVGIPAAGQLMTVFSLSYAILGPLLATALARYSPRTSLTAALCAVTVGNLVCAGAPSLTVALCGRVLVAAGACQFTPHVATLAAASVPEDLRGRALAVVNGGLVTGSVIGVPAGTWVATIAGWRTSLAVLSLGTAMVAAGLLRGLREHTARKNPIGVKERVAALRSPRIRMVLAVTTVAVVAEYAVLTYVGAVFARATGEDGGRLALLLLVFGVGGLGGNALAGVLLGRPAGRHLVLAAMVGMTTAFVLMPWAMASYLAALACMALWGIAGWMYTTPQQDRLLRLAGPAGSLAVALHSSLIYVGGAAGGALGGALLPHLPDHRLPLAAAAICALALVPELLFRRTAAGRPAGSAVDDGLPDDGTLTGRDTA